MSRPILLALICALAGVARLLSWHSVFQSSGVFLNGGDSYYHLRRIRYSVENFPAVLDFDPLMNAPHGAQPIWSPAFDWFVAALLVLVPGIDAPGQIERAIVWIGPLFGVMTVVLTYAIGARFFSPSVGVLGAAALALMPGHVLYSRLANADHHVVVSWLATGLLGLTMHWFRAGPHGGGRLEAGAPRRGRGFGIAALLGLGFAALLAVWPGSLIHVAFLQLGLLGRCVLAPSRDAAIAWAERFAASHAVAAAAIAPLARGREWLLWSRGSPVVLSDFQPLYLSVAAICFAAVAVAFRRLAAGGSRGGRATLAVGVGGFVATVLWMSWPELRSGLFEALSWASKEDEFQALVNESRPLFGDSDTRFATTFLSRFVFLVPLALPALAWRDRRHPERLLFYFWAGAFFSACLLQLRFMNTFAVAHALSIGLLLSSVWALLAPPGSAAGRRVWVGAIGALYVVFALVPSLRSFGPTADNALRALRGGPTSPIGNLARDREIADAVRDLGSLSGGGGRGPGSVLAPWAHGHLIKVASGLPVVQDNFGNDVAPENFRRAAEYFSATTEAAALEAIAPTEARFVLVMQQAAGRPGRLPRTAHFWSLFERRGSGVRRPTQGSGVRVRPALERHRLVHQSAPVRAGAKRPRLIVFEIVAGARIVGRGEPGTDVTLRLPLVPELGMPFEYRAEARVDGGGSYAFRVPYATQGTTEYGNVAVAGPYELDGSEAESPQPLNVPDAAVRDGQVLVGPDLRWRPAVEPDPSES